MTPAIRRLKLPRTERGRTRKRQAWGGTQGLRVEYVTTESPISQPNKEASETVRYMTLGMRREALPGDGNLVVFSM